MSDRFLEKKLLYLLALSLLLHVAVFVAVSRLQTEKPQVKHEPLMVDLNAIPDLSPPSVQKPHEVPPPPHTKVPRTKTAPAPAPPLADGVDRVPPPRHAPPHPPQPGGATTLVPGAPAPVSPEGVRPATEGTAQGTQGDDIFRPRSKERIELSKLFPTGKSMASLEERYRKKYEGAEQGDTRMIDTDDPTIAVFSHRLLVAANDSLRVLSRRTASHGAGVGVLKVTINRDGSVENVKMVESTRSATLDNLALSAVRETGYVGPLPRKWPHEKLNLIWIFVSQQVPQP